MSLTDQAAKAAKPQEKPYKKTDEKGMYLLVHPNGGKYWQLQYRFGGKQKVFSIGAYPEVSLKEARTKRDEIRKRISEGVDPAVQKKIEKLTRHISSENSFENVAREWHDNQKLGWKERHANYVLRRLEADIFPIIGFRPINEIEAPELLAAIRAIEKRGAVDIAKRALQTTGQIFRYAISTGRAKHDLSADLKGALKTRKQTNYARLEEKELPIFLRKLEEYDGEYEGEKQTKLGLKLLLLTMVRTIELRGARWEEFNFEKGEWHIPAERMKMGEKHIVPLSDQAFTLFKELKELNGHREHVFPNRNKPMTFISENTFLYAIYRMGYRSRTTAHGFRGTASTILNEHGFKPDVIERQLAHAERNKVRASYNHAQYLSERKEMMQWWGNYLDNAMGEGEVVFGKFGVTI